MKNRKEAHSRMVEKANAVTQRYLEIVSPKHRRSNSDASLSVR